MRALSTSRRELVALPFLPALLLALGEEAQAAVDPNMTIVKLPSDIKWSQSNDSGRPITATARLIGDSSKPGIYYHLTKWFPGYMSGPHWYETDRLCIVVSGTWWVGSGKSFDPESTVPAPAGSFVRRVARTPHFDGVKRSGTEPAMIAICGMGPIKSHHLEPDKPSWRRV